MKLKITDQLAIERTRLANERTFLAYFRTGIVFSSSGFAIVQIEMLQEIVWIGYFLILIGPILLIMGLIRLKYVKRKIKELYNQSANIKSL